MRLAVLVLIALAVAVAFAVALWLSRDELEMLPNVEPDAEDWGGW